MFEEFKSSSKGLRIIKTARDEKSINEAAKSGFFPLIKKVEPNYNIRSKYALGQDKESGEIKVIYDFRQSFQENRPTYTSLFEEEKSDTNRKNFEEIIDWTYYYPHNFPSPFAAYLIPKDIQIGERVFLEDLIEDYIEGFWNQGNVFRLKNSEAIWNGKDLDIQIDKLPSRILG